MCVCVCVCVCVFFILIWRILPLYVQYSLNKAIDIVLDMFLIKLLILIICDSESKTGASKEKNKVTENTAFDLADVITGRKIVSELTREESITILQNIIALKTEIHYSKNNVSKEEKLEI